MSEQIPAIDFGIVMTSGPDTPKRLASPFFLAATAAAEERSVVVYFTGLGTLLLQKGVAETVFPKEGGKSLAGFMDWPGKMVRGLYCVPPPWICMASSLKTWCPTSRR